jgi:hypothetical protein
MSIKLKDFAFPNFDASEIFGNGSGSATRPRHELARWPDRRALDRFASAATGALSSPGQIDLSNALVAVFFGGRTGYGALPAARDAYALVDRAISPSEVDALRVGRLLEFWQARLGRDPVARVGVSLWGSADDVRLAIRQTGERAWTPDMNLLSAVSLKLRESLPEDLKFPPTTEDELVRYWVWMGEMTRQRVVDRAVKVGVLPAEASATQRLNLIRDIGLDLARGHAEAVSADASTKVGEQAGLLSLEQIAEYHHRVFEAHGLPKQTYGGTPYGFAPDWLEFLLAGGLYAPDADEE